MDNERYQNFSIELDCPPGGIRPKDLIEGVLKDTGIKVSDFETGNPFFGHQTWVLKKSAMMDFTFRESKPLFEARITELYHRGYIRYGTW